MLYIIFNPYLFIDFVKKNAKLTLRVRSAVLCGACRL